MSQNAVNIGKMYPELYRSTTAMSEQAETAALASGLSPRLVELVRIRVSQINGCGFCMRMHTRDALAKGDTTDRISVLPAWRDTAYFDEMEREALAVAERVTRIDDSLRAQLVEADAMLSASQAAAVAWVAIVINSFNRLAIASQYQIGPGS